MGNNLYPQDIQTDQRDKKEHQYSQVLNMEKP